MAITFTVNAQGEGRTFAGIGGVTSNGMTKLLYEYPEAQRNDILDFLFKPNYGASLHLLKVEIGSDANGTCGTEPSHMRSETDYDITRGVGLWMAKEAKKRNPDIILDAIRWGTPAWVTDNEKKYLYYKRFLDGAKSEFGLDFNYLSPDENEGSYSRNWVVNVLRPRLNQDGYSSLKLTGADSTTDWNIATMVQNDSDLKNALSAINAHYRQDSPDAAKNCGLPIYSSENLAAYRYSFEAGLNMAYRMIRCYASGRMVQYQMHPVIEAIYDDVPYTYKGIIAAAYPWTGHYDVMASLWVTAQFTQFIQPGWKHINTGCHAETGYSYLSLINPKTNDVSIVLLNTSNTARDFKITLKGFTANSLYVWQTTEEAQFVHSNDLPIQNQTVTVTVPAMSITTLTTTVGQAKGVPSSSNPDDISFSLPYEDNYQNYSVGKQPRYTVDQSGAFEISGDGVNSQKCLKQVITTALKPKDWERRATPSPYTILGGQNLSNYTASIDFSFDTAQDDPSYDGYFLLGVRCNLSPTGNVPAECYNFRLYEDGRWQLRRAALVLSSGTLTSFTPQSWHHASVSANGDTISVQIDNVTITTTQDTELPSGHVVIGSGYNVVKYMTFRIDPIDQDTPYECSRYTESDTDVEYTGSWAPSGTNAKNYTRSVLMTSQAGDLCEFAFTGTACSLLGIIGPDCGKASVSIDGGAETEIDCYCEDTKYRKSLFSVYHLSNGKHTVRLIVSGSHNTDATDSRIYIDAIEITGGSLIPFEHTAMDYSPSPDRALLVTSFESETIGHIPSDWIIHADSNTSCSVQEEAGIKIACLDDQSSTGTVSMSHSFSPVSERLTMQIRYKTQQAGKWFRFILGSDSTDMIEIYDSNANGLCYRNNSAKDVKIADIQANTWYDIVIDIDLVKSRFHVFLNRSLVRENCTFRRSGNKIDHFRFESGNGFKGKAFITSIRIGQYSLIADDFSNDTLHTEPASWIVSAPSGTTATVETSSADTGRAVILQDDSYTVQTRMYRPFAQQNSKILAELSYMDSAQGTWSRILLGDDTTDAISIYNSDISGLCYRDGSGKDISLASVSSNTWKHFRIVANCKTSHFDFYMDDVLIAAGCHFTHVVNGINRLTLASGESYIGTTCFANIQVRACD